MRAAESASLSTDPRFKVSRALDIFNASEHVQSIAGIARSLGEPDVTAFCDENECVVTIDVAWELSWYRYEIDLCNEAAGPRLADRGYDPAQLGERHSADGVAADKWGRLSLVGAPA